MNEGNQGLQQFARVLLIDDDAEFTRGLSLALQFEGYDVTTLASGMNARQVVAHLRPHVIVLDVMMPGMDGWEVLRQIRSDPAIIDTQVLMLTAKDSEDAKVLGFSLGADDYLTKPFSLRECRCRVGVLARRARGSTDDRATSVKLPVTSGASGHEFVAVRDVYYIQGIRNYTYVYTFDTRFLSRFGLGEMEKHVPENLMRIHRSYIANLDNIQGCRWANSSSYRLTLSDQKGTEIPVSRTLVSEVQQRLRLR